MKKSLVRLSGVLREKSGKWFPFHTPYVFVLSARGSNKQNIMVRGRTNLQASKTFFSFLPQKITLLDLKKKRRYISEFSSGFKTDNYGVQGDKTDKKCRRRIRSLVQLPRRHGGRSHFHLF